MKSIMKIVALLAAVAGFTASASANPTLWLWQDWNPGNSVLVTDGNPLDSSLDANQVGFQGVVGDWNINFTAGVVAGTTSLPEMDLVSMNFSTTASTLWIGFSADGFGPSLGTANASIGGTTDGAIEYWTGLGTANQGLPSAFDYPTPFLAFGSLPGSNNQGFNGAASWNIDDVGPYSLVQWVKITHTGAGNSSFNASLTVPDSGSTALLLGLGLVGVVAATRRNKSKAA